MSQTINYSQLTVIGEPIGVADCERGGGGGGGKGAHNNGAPPASKLPPFARALAAMNVFVSAGAMTPVLPPFW